MVWREREVKVKVECRLLQLLRSSLEELGFKCKEPVMEVDVYYSHPCRDFIETDEALRLRFTGESTARLTYKGPRMLFGRSIKEREEIEIEIDDPTALENILLKLGFKPALKVEKRRTYCGKKEVMVTLDRVKGLGCFLEVEATEETIIDRMLEAIGLGSAERIELTYAEMLGGFKAGKGQRGLKNS